MNSKTPQNIESVVFALAGASLLAAFAASMHMRAHRFANWRLAYAFQHLPPALLSSAFFCFAAAVAYVYLRRRAQWFETRSTPLLLGLIALLFCAFWLPVLLAAGFAQDDWMLLAAASIRQMIPAHPAASWLALDSVDGNFRPLGTVLYFGYAYKLFGLTPLPFLAGGFVLSLAAVLTAFLLVRELGYCKAAAATAAILFLSRGVLYTQIGWASALGDSIVTLLTAITVLILSKAIKRRGVSAAMLHLLGWFTFLIATLGKQSSFTTPLVVAALLYLRPGTELSLPRRRRLVEAVLGFAVYGAAAAAIFRHGQLLLQSPSPYPVHLTAEAVVRSFSYVFWYFAVVYVPIHSAAARFFPAIAGMILVALCVLLLRRFPGVLGERRRDLLFFVLSAVASISLFVLLPTRGQAYYGTMFAFWLSLALGILLTRAATLYSRRLVAFIVCSLVVLGFLDVRLKQIGLLWTGGYVWGTAESAHEQESLQSLDRVLRANPAAHVAVLVDAPFQVSYYTAMAMLLAPRLDRILVYNSGKGTYLANDRGGLRPGNDLSGLRDVEGYNWRTPFNLATDPALALRLAHPDETLWIRFVSPIFTQSTPPPAAGPQTPSDRSAGASSRISP